MSTGRKQQWSLFAVFVCGFLIAEAGVGLDGEEPGANWEEQFTVGGWVFLRADGARITGHNSIEGESWREFLRLEPTGELSLLDTNRQKCANVSVVDGRLEGEMHEWYPDGKTRCVGSFENGKRSGEWRSWDNEGRLTSKTHYEEGTPDGTWEFWYENGKLASRCSYRAGVPVGQASCWHVNGQLSIAGQFDAQGRPDGLWGHWYENGQLQYEGHMRAGKKVGAHREWHVDGSKWFERVFEDGKPVETQAWDAEGALIASGTYRNGEPWEGTFAVRQWERSGDIGAGYIPPAENPVAVTKYVAGVPVGVATPREPESEPEPAEKQQGASHSVGQ